MERYVWEKIVGFIPVEKYPQLPCPYCKNQNLSLDENSISYRKSECAEIKALIDKENKEKMEQLAGAFKTNVLLGVLVTFGTVVTGVIREPAKFIAFFKCSHCGMDVSSTGTCQYPKMTNQYSEENSPLIKVEYFSPPVPIFDVGVEVPESVKNELLQAFNHFHSDLSSSGTKLRRSVEKLCHELGFKEKNLHYSLSALEKVYPKEGALLNSLKLLGNEAVHSEDVNEEDILDAFEIQEFILGLFERINNEVKAHQKAEKLLAKYKKSQN